MQTRIQIPPSGQVALAAVNTSPQKVAQLMAELVRALRNDPTVRAIANDLIERAADYRSFLQNLAQYVYERVYFYPDPMTTQFLRTPQRSLVDARGNCVDYSIFVASVAASVGLPTLIRIAQLPGQTNFGHVYPVVNGLPVDLTIIQRQDGLEATMREPGKRVPVGSELSAVKTMDFLIN